MKKNSFTYDELIKCAEMVNFLAQVMQNYLFHQCLMFDRITLDQVMTGGDFNKGYYKG